MEQDYCSKEVGTFQVQSVDESLGSKSKVESLYPGRYGSLRSESVGDLPLLSILPRRPEWDEGPLGHETRSSPPCSSVPKV